MQIITYKEEDWKLRKLSTFDSSHTIYDEEINGTEYQETISKLFDI